MRNKVKGGYSIELKDEYKGRNSPSVTHYSPNHGLNKSNSKTVTIARAPKYKQNTTMDNLRASLPIQYTDDGLCANISTYLGQNKASDSTADLTRASGVIHRLKKNDRYKYVDIGCGSRSDFTNIPQLRSNPGAIYNTHLA